MPIPIGLIIERCIVQKIHHRGLLGHYVTSMPIRELRVSGYVRKHYWRAADNELNRLIHMLEPMRFSLPGVSGKGFLTDYQIWSSRRLTFIRLTIERSE
jgi:hypothetical protein